MVRDSVLPAWELINRNFHMPNMLYVAQVLVPNIPTNTVLQVNTDLKWATPSTLVRCGFVAFLGAGPFGLGGTRGRSILLPLAAVPGLLVDDGVLSVLMIIIGNRNTKLIGGDLSLLVFLDFLLKGLGNGAVSAGKNEILLGAFLLFVGVDRAVKKIDSRCPSSGHNGQANLLHVFPHGRINSGWKSDPVNFLPLMLLAGSKLVLAKSIDDVDVRLAWKILQKDWGTLKLIISGRMNLIRLVKVGDIILIS